METDSNRFQIISERLIYFYEMQPSEKRCKDFIPVHVSTMFNFTQCSGCLMVNNQMNFITYKVGQPDISIFMCKYIHTFMETIDSKTKANVTSHPLCKFNSFLVANSEVLEVTCVSCFKTETALFLPLTKPNGKS